MVKKYKNFVLSDVHGNYDAMMTALSKVDYDMYNPEHRIICCGDYFGRAEQMRGDSLSVWKYLTSEEHVNKPICIRGNHEGIILDIFKRGHITYLDECNGEHYTIASFANTFVEYVKYDDEYVRKAEKTGLRDWIESLPWCYRTKNAVFTHGWIPYGNVDGCLHYSDEVWDEISWTNTSLEMDFVDETDARFQHKLFVGHWHAAEFWSRYEGTDFNYGHIYEHKQSNIVFLDCCTAMERGMEVYVFEDEEDEMVWSPLV